MRPRGFADGFEYRATISTRRVVTPRAFFETAPHGELNLSTLIGSPSPSRGGNLRRPSCFSRVAKWTRLHPGIAAHTPVSNAPKPTRRHVRHRCPDHRPRHRAGEGLQGRRQGAEVLVSALRSARFRRFFFIGDGAAPPRKALPRDARRGARATRVSPVARAPARLRAAPNRTRPRLGRFARARPSRLRRGRRSRDRFSAVSGPGARTARAGRRG